MKTLRKFGFNNFGFKISKIFYQADKIVSICATFDLFILGQSQKSKTTAMDGAKRFISSEEFQF